MGRATTHVYEVSAPNGEILGLVRAASAGQALRRINELCGVPCTVLGRRVFFAEQYRRDCAGRWLVRIVRLSVKAANLMTRNYVAEGPTAEAGSRNEPPSSQVFIPACCATAYASSRERPASIRARRTAAE